MVKSSKYAKIHQKLGKKTFERQARGATMSGGGGRADDAPLTLPSANGFVGYWCDHCDFRFS